MTTFEPENDPLLTFDRKPVTSVSGRLFGLAGRAGVFLILAAGVALGFSFWNLGGATQAGTGSVEALSGKVSAQALTGTLSGATPRLGPANAKVVLVAFSDFECPYCKQSAPVLRQLQAKYGDRVLFVHRDFPLTEIHPFALAAAMAGKCAQEQGKFWELHDLMFANQDQLSEATLKTLALQLNLDSIAFSRCFAEGKYFEDIKRDFNTGVAAGVESTPTFFINNEKLEGALPIDEYESVIEAALVNG